LLAHRPTPKLEDHPLSVVRDCLFNISAATLHTAGRSSIHNLRTLHTVLTGTHLSLLGKLHGLCILEPCGTLRKHCTGYQRCKILGKGKGKVHPRTRHEDPEGE